MPSTYSAYVQSYLDAFGRSAVKVVLFEELMANLEENLAELMSFLDVDPSFEVPDLGAKNVGRMPRSQLVARLARKSRIRELLPKPVISFLRNRILFRESREPLDTAFRDMLYERHFAGDVKKLEAVLGRGLEIWNPRVR